MDKDSSPKSPALPGQPGSLPVALLTGTLVDILGTNVVVVIIAFFYVITLQKQGLSEPQILALMASSNSGSLFYWVLNLVGFLMSVNAGYWCARVARRSSLLAPAIQSLLSSAICVALTLQRGFTAMDIAMTAANLLGVLLGGAIFLQARKKAQAA